MLDNTGNDTSTGSCDGTGCVASPSLGWGQASAQRPGPFPVVGSVLVPPVGSRYAAAELAVPTSRERFSSNSEKTPSVTRSARHAEL